MNITIIGATGNIGRVAAETLLAKGHKVRAVARTASKLAELKAKGAEVLAADAKDAAAMARAFAGADAAFMMIPPSMGEKDFRKYQNVVAQAQAEGAKKAGLKRVVVLSSIGAHMSADTGPILGVHDFEELLKREKIPTDVLRPCYFMENHLNAIGSIKGAGAIFGGLAAEPAFPQVATKDIGLKAAELLESGQGNAVHYVYGPKEYSMADTARILGAAVGKPDLKHVQVPFSEVKKALLGYGVSENVADVYLEMFKGFNEGKILPTQPPGPGNRGKTTLEDFARDVFKPAFGL